MNEQSFARSVEPIRIEDEMRASYLDYSMSVIVGRALPNVRDGLKPVHRRILYAMLREGQRYNSRYSKCAGVVGEVLKKYHPHGDSAVYDALVRMAQPWNMRYPLVDGQGNFGSIDGDRAAAYRYTECRMTRVTEELVADIDKDTVDFQANFDETTLEPLTLPARLPNLLINGSDGIAVGMATKIPPHNVRETVAAAIAVLDRPDIELSELMELLPGPDFPTGATIYGRTGIHDLYSTGRGRIILRGRAFVEEKDKERTAIIIDEIPYQVNKSRLLENIADLVRSKKIEGIHDLRDETDRHGLRVVIELKRDGNPEIILNKLYKHTALQSTFGAIFLAIDRGRPRVMTLREMLDAFIDHRREVTVRRCRFELQEAEDRIHILEGLLKALDAIDEIIALIRASQSPEEARRGLVEGFEFSPVQAQAILDMRLQRLTGLERDKLEAEHLTLQNTIKELQAILGSEERLKEVLRDEMLRAAERYYDERRTNIVDAEGDIDIEDLIPDEESVVTVSNMGYVKRTPLTEYRAQRRGGRGKAGMNTREEDVVTDLFVARNLDTLLVFTENGKLFWLKVYRVPEGGRNARGRPVVNLLQIDDNDRVVGVLPVRDFDDERSVVTVSRRGQVKRTVLSQYKNMRQGTGIIAAGLRDGDQVVGARMVTEGQTLLVSTRLGKAIRFAVEAVRPMGRTAAGVRAVSLGSGDEVLDISAVDENAVILVVTEHGFGKRTQASEYRIQSRGGKGLISIKTGSRNGKVAGVVQVDEDQQVLLVTTGGILIRMKASDIRQQGRNTMGVRLIRTPPGETVVGLALVAESDDGEDGEGVEDDAGAGGVEQVGETGKGPEE